ncbi:Zn-ribbon domain-containing OB-fold protein [Microbacterium sp. No. 7]|uniref:Zn-ribbon domain-containing OB-fold protein n=1 Tax=Microbacterium sp. No. 7 TaxID=1714373 RepID=UPI0006D1828A|nr:OB-fold domain-containing protein [Microbacterium sp. No. 7]ALJ22164.1 hypothetical protein AOA12_20675 [Microbacterium sp. No. 7]
MAPETESWPQPYRLLDAEPYWAALQERRLTYQRCDACAQAVWPPHRYCPYCDSPDLTWNESTGRGQVYTYSAVGRGATPIWEAIAPYTVGFVTMDDGYALFGQILGEPDDIRIGMDVAVEFVERGEQTLPVFAPVPTNEEG